MELRLIAKDNIVLNSNFKVEQGAIFTAKVIGQ